MVPLYFFRSVNIPKISSKVLRKELQFCTSYPEKRTKFWSVTLVKLNVSSLKAVVDFQEEYCTI